MVSLSTLFKIVFAAISAVYMVQYWLNTKQYMVDYKDIELIAKRNAVREGDIKLAFTNIENDLRKLYKGHIVSTQDTQWIFVNCGGWMGHMYLLHASLSEYILFFGTAVDTSGHSGRYWANITDTIISGSFRQWKEGEVESLLYKPGDTVVHEWGEAAAVQWTAGTYMVEYGRGFIPSTLTFALADTIFGTTDFFTLYYTLRIYATALLNEAMQYL